MSPEHHIEHCCTDNFFDEGCFPIPVRLSDTFYSSLNVNCLDFPRSENFCNENGGAQQQFNENTHFVDASNVYGNTDER